jgi:hypothetical protein
MGVSRVKYVQNSSGAVRDATRGGDVTQAVDSPTPDDDDESRLTDRRTKRSPSSSRVPFVSREEASVSP